VSTFDFSGKTVLITGASQGIGRATAIAFAEAGARVAVHFNRRRDKADETLAHLAGTGHVAVQANLINPAVVETMVSDVLARFGQIDILVNNAATNQPHRLDAVDYQTWQAAWQQIIGVNLVGTANVSYCVARHMIERHTGRIVNVSSRGAFRGEPDNPAYGASKAGLNAFSQSLAQYVAPHNIFVTSVAPGFVETERVQPIIEARGARQQSPLNRVAQPEEVAHTILFLASTGAEFLTGAVVDVNGASYLR
jgi:NAD(P)-dependent dehydrogenase (short-subunit alcohol dehydrogenase family)